MPVTEAFIAERDKLSKYRKAKAFVEYLEKKKARLKDPEDLEDIGERIRIKQANADRLKREVLDRIYLLDNVVYWEILELYFIEGVSMPDISERIGYTERHTRKLYSDAMNILAEL